jgi:hypothetical protein
MQDCFPNFITKTNTKGIKNEYITKYESSSRLIIINIIIEIKIDNNKILKVLPSKRLFPYFKINAKVVTTMTNKGNQKTK